MDRSGMSVRCLALIALGCAVALLGAIGTATAGEIHPSNPRVLHGVVTAVRHVEAYAGALSASATMWGDIQCAPGEYTVAIKQSSIFRVETASRYYDLSKLCGMGSDFRWPRVYKQHSGYHLYTWNHYEQLKVGERVMILAGTYTVRLAIFKCQALGLINRREARLAYNPMSITGQKIYKSHCVYKVPIMHVRISYYTTANGTAPIDQTWDFRIVGSGPISAAKTTQIGSGYSASLPPLF